MRWSLHDESSCHLSLSLRSLHVEPVLGLGSMISYTHVCYFLRLFVCWVIFFNPRKIQQFSEVAPVVCCLFAQYLNEGLLPSVAGSNIAAPIITREDGQFSRNNHLSYAGPSSIATKYESDDHLETCSIMKAPLHVTFSPGVFTNNNPSNTILVTIRFWGLELSLHQSIHQ